MAARSFWQTGCHNWMPAACARFCFDDSAKVPSSTSGSSRMRISIQMTMNKPCPKTSPCPLRTESRTPHMKTAIVCTHLARSGLCPIHRIIPHGLALPRVGRGGACYGGGAGCRECPAARACFPIFSAEEEGQGVGLGRFVEPARQEERVLAQERPADRRVDDGHFGFVIGLEPVG